MIDNTRGALIDGLLIHDVGDEALHLRTASSDNTVQATTIRRTGLRKAKFGEGIYIGSARSNWCTYTDCGPDRSDRNLIQNNDIADTTAEAIDVKEGTSSGTLRGNTLSGAAMTARDSWVDVKGNDWTIADNMAPTPPRTASRPTESSAAGANATPSEATRPPSTAPATPSTSQKRTSATPSDSGGDHTRSRVPVRSRIRQQFQQDQGGLERNHIDCGNTKVIRDHVGFCGEVAGHLARQDADDQPLWGPVDYLDHLRKVVVRATVDAGACFDQLAPGENVQHLHGAALVASELPTSHHDSSPARTDFARGHGVPNRRRPCKTRIVGRPLSVTKNLARIRKCSTWWHCVTTGGLRFLVVYE